MQPQSSQGSMKGESNASYTKRMRRPRAIQACNFCRSKKYKCDGSWPCLPCQRYREECVFRGTNPMTGISGYSVDYVQDLERRLRAAELALVAHQDSQLGPTSPRSATTTTPQESGRDSTTVLTPSSTQRNISVPPTSAIGSIETKTVPISDPQDDSDDGETEVVEIDPITHSVEFHGNTSSIAFLGRVRQEYSDPPDDRDPVRARSERPSLVSAFQNTHFGPKQDAVLNWNDGSDERLFDPRLYVFIETYFNNLHYIHPIIDQTDFLHRCKDLWMGHAEKQPRSFIALYFATLSLGALVRTWTEEKINEMGRFDWSRMLFARAESTLGKPGHLSDLHAIHTLFLLAKVCQNELNPNLAYIYLGMAIRSALSVGLNRNALPSYGHPEDERAQLISRTWWGLYSLEVELSFALGRPDTLGMEDFHNRPKPPVEDSEMGILTSMLGLSKIMRSTSVTIYLSKGSVAEKLPKAFGIETDIDAWVETLPERIRPNMPAGHKRNELRDPTWARRQRLVLQIRYYNVKMLLLRPFILHATKLSVQNRPLPPRMDEAIAKCTSAAINTIEIVYETCRLHTFFRTWWYNTTYVTFAASILLFCAAHPKLCSPSSTTDQSTTSFLPLIDKSLDILDAMCESVVARKTAAILRQMLARLTEREKNTPQPNQMSSQHSSPAQPSGNSNPMIAPRSMPQQQQQQQLIPQPIHQLPNQPLMMDPRFDAVFPEAMGTPGFALGMWDLGGPQGGYGTWDMNGYPAEEFWPT